MEIYQEDESINYSLPKIDPKKVYAAGVFIIIKDYSENLEGQYKFLLFEEHRKKGNFFSDPGGKVNNPQNLNDLKLDAIRELREESMNTINLHPKDLSYYIFSHGYLSFIVFIKSHIDLKIYQKNRNIVAQGKNVGDCYLETLSAKYFKLKKCIDKLDDPDLKNFQFQGNSQCKIFPRALEILEKMQNLDFDQHYEKSKTILIKITDDLNLIANLPEFYKGTISYYSQEYESVYQMEKLRLSVKEQKKGAGCMLFTENKEQDQFVLLFRNKSNIYQEFGGGFNEQDENLFQTCQRETQEESKGIIQLINQQNFKSIKVNQYECFVVKINFEEQNLQEINQRLKIKNDGLGFNNAVMLSLNSIKQSLDQFIKLSSNKQENFEFQNNLIIRKRTAVVLQKYLESDMNKQIYNIQIQRVYNEKGDIIFQI